MDNHRVFQRRIITSRKQKRGSKAKMMLGLLLILVGFYYLTAHSGLAFFTNRSGDGVVSAAFSQQATDYLQKNLANNQQVPLVLQKDQRYADLAYGTEDQQNDFASNGCALASLAMIDGFWQGKTADPRGVLDWAGNRYYVQGQGTSWEIFPEFASSHGYQFENLGNSVQQAETFMQQGIPVIVSVQPGTFTTTGHIMVLAHNTQGKIIALDPNDSPAKNHYQMTFTPKQFQKEAINYWALWQ